MSLSINQKMGMNHSMKNVLLSCTCINVTNRQAKLKYVSYQAILHGAFMKRFHPAEFMQSFRIK
jgi:hypothetical protein